MEFLSNIENMPLFAALLFVWLWRKTSPESTYETVEMETVSTKKVFLVLAITCLAFWLAIRFYW